ncbi:MAG TPA: hypothetical protein VL068_11125 [Microthrixaceae bacterium]|nr:hypothetical protein [Microthrixaceae bacterium]
MHLRLPAVESDYEAAAQRMLDAQALDTGPGRNEYGVDAAPRSGRVLHRPSGEPAMVVWTWTDGLAVHHPQGIVFDPDGLLWADGRFNSAVGQSTLESCERISGNWWWCAQY